MVVGRSSGRPSLVRYSSAASVASPAPERVGIVVQENP